MSGLYLKLSKALRSVESDSRKASSHGDSDGLVRSVRSQSPEFPNCRLPNCRAAELPNSRVADYVMTRAVLFDFGGTLDADGLHWSDRFARAYRQAGRPVDPDPFRAAFVAAERVLAGRNLQGWSFRALLELQVRLQMEALGWLAPTGASVAPEEAARWVAAVADFCYEEAAACLRRNRSVLAELQARSYRLGVVANFPGNLADVCREFGLTDFLDVIVDSTVEGIAKPDPRIFQRALDRLGLPPSACWFVGDSLEKDILPARQLGFRTVWIVPAEKGPAAHPAADAVIHRLPDILAVLPR